jgi:hypothetical protein
MCKRDGASLCLKEWELVYRSGGLGRRLANKCPRVGTVSKSFQGFNGETVNRFLENAGVMIKSLPRTGVATITQVVIFGGNVLTA